MKNSDKYKNNPEFTQAIFRLVIWLTITSLIWIQVNGEIEKLQIQNYFIFMTVFLVLSVVILISILIIPKSTLRPYLTTFIDLGSVSYTMILSTAGPFSAYYLLFPWVFVGYGTRYSRGPLSMAAFISLIGYIFVLNEFDSWNSDPFSSLLFSLFLIILPLYIYKMTSKIKRLQENAIAANKIKSEFLATISHEIRTPMSGIIGMTSLLENTKLDQNQKEYVAALQQSSTALHALINDVLDVSKIEAGKYTLQSSNFNLTKIINSVVQIFTPLAHAKGVELINFIQPNIPLIVKGDPDKLRQIVLNLMSNAVKFTEQGEISIYTTVAKIKENEKVRIKIEVRDTGLGIPNQQLEKIFEPFYQGKNISPNKHSGTGLGTTISHQLATLMNGEIAACSNLNKGSVFWIEIPFYYCEFQDEQFALPHPNVSDVIVLDDVESSSQATETYLNSLKIKPLMLNNQNAVIYHLAEKFNNQTIVILSESLLTPDLSQFAIRLRQEFATKIYIIVISNIEVLHLSDSEHQNIYDDYIVRPFDALTLKQSINSLYFDDRPTLNDNLIDKPVAKNNNETHNILVVEDNNINAKIICTFLEQEGHKTKRVISGLEALTALTNEKFDLVFMDMRMSEMDGTEATQKWRQQDINTTTIESEINIPIVALTANATTDDKELCLDSGMDKFLSKPVSKDEIIRVIETLVVTK